MTAGYRLILGDSGHCIESPLHTLPSLHAATAYQCSIFLTALPFIQITCIFLFCIFYFPFTVYLYTWDKKHAWILSLEISCEPYSAWNREVTTYHSQDPSRNLCKNNEKLASNVVVEWVYWNSVSGRSCWRYDQGSYPNEITPRHFG